MKKVKEVLCIFTRFPRPGITKTRLIPFLGAKRSADLQRQMTEHVFHQCLKILEKRQVNIQVHYNGASLPEMREWVPQGLECFEQCGGNIGKKMQHALNKNLEGEGNRVIIIGADCPGVSAELVEMAFDVLAEQDIVFGPAKDGGFYLVGIKRKSPFLLENIDWQTDETLEQLMVKIKDEKMTSAALKTLEDIDRPGDLKYLKQYGIDFSIDH